MSSSKFGKETSNGTGTGSAPGSRAVMKVIRPLYSADVPVFTVPPRGQGEIATTQCPEYHFELSSKNVSEYIGTDGQPKLEWVLGVPPK